MVQIFNTNFNCQLWCCMIFTMCWVIPNSSIGFNCWNWPGLDLSLTDRGWSCSKYLRRNWKLKNYLETKLRGSFNFLNSDLVDWIETGKVLETRLESFHNFTQHCRWSNHLLLFQALNLPQLWSNYDVEKEGHLFKYEPCLDKVVKLYNWWPCLADLVQFHGHLQYKHSHHQHRFVIRKRLNVSLSKR